VVSEKSYSLITDRKYTFKVHEDAHKTQIRQAVEELFDVKVVEVRTASVKSKPKRRGLTSGRTRSWKKAIVQVRPGDHVRLVDFGDPLGNDWFAVNQFTVIEGQHNRRPDIVVFVNGLPLAVLELKNPADENDELNLLSPQYGVMWVAEAEQRAKTIDEASKQIDQTGVRARAITRTLREVEALPIHEAVHLLPQSAEAAFVSPRDWRDHPYRAAFVQQSQLMAIERRAMPHPKMRCGPNTVIHTKRHWGCEFRWGYMTPESTPTSPK
jgi:large subunit ribosomal protein L23